jgi:hypothetical protein
MKIQKISKTITKRYERKSYEESLIKETWSNVKTTSNANKTISVGNNEKSRNLEKRLINKFQIGLPVKISMFFDYSIFKLKTDFANIKRSIL